ncbi:MAG: heavy-metal-associated domain-containing protein [Maritimibacter sp.]|nr:heavy-metal-associated domain-containing protein [Maritimibacter sp.]
MTKFNVPDMTCGHCKMAIEKAVTAADEAADLAFDLDARTVTVSSTLDDAALAGILAKEGYPATPAG